MDNPDAQIEDTDISSQFAAPSEVEEFRNTYKSLPETDLQRIMDTTFNEDEKTAAQMLLEERRQKEASRAEGQRDQAAEAEQRLNDDADIESIRNRLAA